MKKLRVSSYIDKKAWDWIAKEARRKIITESDVIRLLITEAINARNNK